MYFADKISDRYRIYTLDRYPWISIQPFLTEPFAWYFLWKWWPYRKTIQPNNIVFLLYGLLWWMHDCCEVAVLVHLNSAISVITHLRTSFPTKPRPYRKVVQRLPKSFHFILASSGWCECLSSHMPQKWGRFSGENIDRMGKLSGQWYASYSIKHILYMHDCC